jgi:hypothetical protein
MLRSQGFGSLAAVAFFPLAAAVAAGPAPTDVPLGMTDLLIDPACTVGYKLDTGDAHTLGWRWTGFDNDSGVYFLIEPTDPLHNQVFMHCPWVKGPGVAFADFPVRLPATTPIRLEVRTALREGAQKTDGVTYRVIVDGNTLWENHCTWKAWRNFSVDLSAYSGRVVTLRLEVDPGPARKMTDDWSLWGKAVIVAGTEAQVAAAQAQADKRRAEELRRELAAAEKRAAADLSPFARGDVTDPRPGTAAPVKNSIVKHGSGYVLTCRAADETIEYRVDPAGGLLDGLQVAVNGKLLEPRPYSADLRVMLGGKERFFPSAFLKMNLVSASVEGSALVCRYEYRATDADDAATLTARLRPVGKSLVMSLQGPPGRFTYFAVKSSGTEVQTTFGIGPIRFHKGGVYVGHFVDVWQSDASGVGNSDLAAYNPLTDGSRRAVRDTFYLTVSSRYEEVLPNIPNRPSPFLGELAGRVVLDGWGGTFAENEQWLRDMARYGVDHFLMIKHVWQRDGYDCTYPDVMPANKAYGGDDALRSLSLTAQKIGHRFCVHENFYDYYPNAEDFRQEDCALNPEGKTMNGWWNGAVQAVILKPSKLMDYVRRFSPEVKRRYDCNAAYHDIMPTWNIDYDARVPDSGMARRTHEYTRELCDYWRKLYGGPVLFEGIDSHISGIYDGGDNHGLGNYQTPAAGAFELLKVHPKMSNHGFGYYERWLPWGYTVPAWGSYVMTDRELDMYRATEVAFGRTGFIGQQLMQSPHAVVREYYLMQAFARAYTARDLRRLAYYVENEGRGYFVDAGTAARYREWSRVRATYDGGQEVYANLSDKPWTVAGHVLAPKGGALAVGPRAEAWTAVVDGQIADFARYGDVTYADARSHQWLPPTPPPPIKPTLGEWKDNGDGTFDVTVNWEVGRTLPKDYTIFVHFIAIANIVFQADHMPPKPTSQWQVGEVIKDGPIRVRVTPNDPNAEYTFLVGLYDKDGRVPLVSGMVGRALATLEVVRDGDKVVKVEFKPADQQIQPGLEPGPYLEGANREKKVVDFGVVATNGAVVIRKTAGGVEIVPVPIGEAMRVGLKGAFKTASADGKPIKTSVEGGKVWFEVPAGASKVVLR